MLLQAGALVDGYPGDTETPLITAASYGDAEVARVLIEAGADIEAVSAPDSGGVPSGTALTHAAVFSPLYWLMASVAMIKAGIQAVNKPTFWEKTVHGLFETTPH